MLNGYSDKSCSSGLCLLTLADTDGNLLQHQHGSFVNKYVCKDEYPCLAYTLREWCTCTDTGNMLVNAYHVTGINNVYSLIKLGFVVVFPQLVFNS